MECCVCYDEKALYINCGHELCRDCFSKLNSLSCPICRTKIKGLLIEKPKIRKTGKQQKQAEVIEVDEVGGRKTIMMSNLKRYVFSRIFKKVLENNLHHRRRGYRMPFSNYLCIAAHNTRYFILNEPFDEMTTNDLLLLLLGRCSIKDNYTDNEMARNKIYSILLSRSKQLNK